MDISWEGVAAVIVAVVGAGGAGALITAWFQGRRYLVQTRARIERDARADVVKEWQGIVDHMENQIGDLNKENKSLRVQVHNFRDKYHEDILALAVANHKCREEAERLRGEMALMQSVINRLQVQTGDVSTPVMPGLIIADMDGVIVEASPAVFPILGWLPHELRGKNVDVLIPPRLRDQHHEALGKLKETKQLPWSERVLTTEAQEKGGKEVPVTVALAGRRVGEVILIAAEIKRRPITAVKLDRPGERR